MRPTPFLLLAPSLALAACGSSDKKQAEADAHAAGFVPPSVLSRLDFGGQVERRFHALDRDQDDVIAADELPRQNSRLAGLDRNKDGEITSSEWSEGMLARFDANDLNHDGSVTSEEQGRARAAREQAAGQPPR